ncbi:MAG: hypothetical protein M1575_02520 [Patescibacteria group bacterium]|nr:hypothetical protein [Patescibacteria group bacterium]
MTSQEGVRIENLPGFDPIWFEYGSKIMALSRIIDQTGPQTETGKKLVELEAQTLLFRYYRRLIPVYGVLIALIESELAEIIDKKTQDKVQPKTYFFDDPVNQRVALRAFGLVIERAIKVPCSLSDPSCYQDYRRFFEEIEGGLILRRDEGDSRCQPSLDFRIETAYKPDDFLGEMAGIFSECVNTQIQKGSKHTLAFSMNDLSVNIYEIRNQIRDEMRKLGQDQRLEITRAIRAI